GRRDGGETAEERHPGAVPGRAARAALLRLHAERLRQDDRRGVLAARRARCAGLRTTALERGRAGPRSEAVECEDDAGAAAGSGRSVRPGADARRAPAALQALM